MVVDDAPEGTDNEALFVDSMRRCREIQGISQGDLATRLVQAGWHGFRQTTVSRIEKRERTVRLAEAHAIANCLGFSLSDMLREDMNTGKAERLRALDDEIRDLNEGVSSLIAQCVQLQAKLYQVSVERETLARSMGTGTPTSADEQTDQEQPGGIIDLMDILSQSLTGRLQARAAARDSERMVKEARNDG